MVSFPDVTVLSCAGAHWSTGIGVVSAMLGAGVAASAGACVGAAVGAVVAAVLGADVGGVVNVDPVDEHAAATRIVANASAVGRSAVRMVVSSSWAQSSVDHGEGSAGAVEHGATGRSIVR